MQGPHLGFESLHEKEMRFDVLPHLSGWTFAFLFDSSVARRLSSGRFHSISSIILSCKIKT